MFFDNLWKNAVGTADQESPYGSWLKYWEVVNGCHSPYYCTVCGCDNRTTLGAHVVRANGSKDMFIVPMCYACNARSDSFGLNNLARPVPVPKKKRAF